MTPTPSPAFVVSACWAGIAVLNGTLVGMANDDPTEFITPLEVSAVAAYEVFKALIGAGFTEDQALTYLARIPHGSEE